MAQVKEVRPYTKGEEIFNGVSHITGSVFGIAVLIIGVICAALFNDIYAVISMIIYGLSMIILYTMSSVYHSLKPGRAKNIFHILDHCTIFLLIAGTYTPFCLVSLREIGAWGWALFGCIWFFAALGIIFNAIDMHNKIIKTLSMIAYLVMGWCAIIAIVPLLQVLSAPGFALLIGGGIAYTVGTLFYAFGRRKKYIHSVWHLFVLLGSVLHFFTILYYVILV